MAVIALLACRHFVEYGSSETMPNPSTPEEECPEGCGFQFIEKEWREKWNVDCFEIGCSYHTEHGWRKASAQESAERHRQRYGHSCRIGWYSAAPATGKRQVKRRAAARRAEKFSGKLPEDGAPPF